MNTRVEDLYIFVDKAVRTLQFHKQLSACAFDDLWHLQAHVPIVDIMNPCSLRCKHDQLMNP